MSDIAIRVEGLGKRFRVRHAEDGGAPRTLREDLLHAPRRLLRAVRGLAGSSGDFWALRDISFEVKRGEVLGLIGRNGAGKSTLLKILSRIVAPTTGVATLHGRVGSLLEVGTGFHPELTGRENIFLSGALLGMRRHEIRSRFDEIVAFAGVERFLDTPCKHFSSGMYTRLGFSVAAHLDAEILLVDEVLAVGDLEFQRRCLGKMESIARAGRTILLVSHNMAAIEAMSHCGLLVEGGCVAALGPIGETVRRYLAGAAAHDGIPVESRRDRGGDGTNRLLRAFIGRPLATVGSPLHVGQSVGFNFVAEREMDRLIFAIYGKSGELVADFDSRQISHRSEPTFPCREPTCHVHSLLLVPGRYTVNVALFNQDRMTDHVERALHFEVRESEVGGLVIGPSARGVAVFPHVWASVGGVTE